MKKANAIIKKVSGNLAYALDNIKWSKLYTDYLQENIAEEKRHDRMRPAAIDRLLTIRQAAALFAVQQIVNYHTGQRAPDVAGYSYMRHSVFTAYSLAACYPKEIAAALNGIDLDYIKALDYAEMMNP